MIQTIDRAEGDFRVKIGDLFKISKGKKVEEVFYSYNENLLRYIQIDDLRNNINIKYCKQELNSVVCNKDDILIVWDGANAGTIGYGLEGVIGSTIAKLTLIKDKIHIPYIGHFLKSRFNYFNSLCTGATIPHIQKDSLINLEIPLPPLDIQKKIAAILDKADQLRQKRKQAIEKLDQLIQSVFLEMFGDPVSNPKGWEVKTLGELSDITSGVTKGKKLIGNNICELPYLRVANVQDSYLDLSEIKTIFVSKNDANKYKLEFGDVLFTEGGDADKLGRGTIWKDEIFNCIHQNHIFRVRLKDNFIIPQYLSTLASNNYGKHYFLKAAKQTTGIATINSNQLKNFPVIISPFSLQKKFENIIFKIEEEKNIIKKSQTHLNILFNSILHKAFRGELEFNDKGFTELEKAEL